ncbi:MAG TPA: cytochrome c biogenesis protein CcdA [Thermoanaerobaculia bacterium]|jgi:thiol:disulfide interchange protein DsbD
MRAIAVALFSFLLPLSPLVAQIGFPGADDTPKVTIEGAVNGRTGDDVQGTITAKIAEGWHVNSHTPSEEFAIPTVLELDPTTAENVKPTYPAHAMKAFEFTGGKQLAVYDGTIRIPFTAKLKTGVTKIRATLNYQACSDRICLPPNRATAEFDVTPVAGAAPVAATPVATAPGATTKADLPVESQGGVASEDRLAKVFASSGLPLTLGILFLGGLALNLTPCVFPLIPITLGFFAMQSDGRRSRRFGLSAMYVVGIVITYTALGILASLGGKMFGAFLQLPAVLIGFALLMLILSASMFGAYEIQPPKFIANRSQGRAGMFGALSMGLLIGIVAAPCVGPVVISLVTLVAQIGDPLIGAAMFATLAFGLGFPYLVALNALPRPGEWMVTVKKGMGFVLIAMAFYFLRPLVDENVFKYGVAASLLIGAAFVLISKAKGAKMMRIAVGVVLLVAGVFFAMPHPEGVHVQWQAYEANALSAATTAKQKPIVVDFTADWCIPCKEMDARTFSNAGVAAELGRFTLVRADVTKDTPSGRELMKRYGVVGPPTILFLDAAGNEIRNLRLTGFEEPEKFLDRLKKVQ